MRSKLVGMRTLIKDLWYGACFTGVVITAMVLHVADLGEVIWKTAIALGVLAGKDVLGKAIAGSQAIRRERENGGGS